MQSGSKLISGPMADQIAGSPLPVTVPVEVTTTDQVNPGGVVTTTAVLRFDLADLAQDVLEERVRPGVVAAGYPPLAPTAWVVLDLPSTAARFALPAGTTGTGTPVASSASTAATAAFVAGGVQVDLGPIGVDTRTPGPPVEVSVTWQVLDGGAPAPRSLEVVPPVVSFTSAVSVGLLFYGAPVVGTVTVPWACTADAPASVLATTEVVSAPVSTTASTTPSTVATTGTTAASTTTTATTWPTATTIPPDSCAVDGFDRFGGWTGRQLEATGRFRTEQVDGRWWFVTPEGHPFFSAGINHITASGTPDRNGDTLYADTVVAKYGDHQTWADAQVARMGDWGFNTIGAWSDLHTLRGSTPYTVLLGMTGQNFGTGQMVDLWDPAWVAGVEASAMGAAATYGDDPFLLGYWTDNELHFGPDWRLLHLFDDYLARPATAPGKQALVAWLQSRYPTFAAFEVDIATSATDWASLAEPSSVESFTVPAGQDTRTAWMGVVAERYFSVTDAALTAADPDHLNLGPRLLAQTSGVPVLEAAARHVDVTSLNRYPLVPELEAPLRNADPSYLPVDDAAAAQAAVTGGPILISEWSYRAADSGLPNTWPPLFPTLETQDQRAAAAEAYVSELLDAPWIVGQHWFEHADEPAAGRFDGEDSNFGLVSELDEPYHPLVDVMATLHDCAYARLLAPVGGGSTTTTTLSAPSSTGTTTATSTDTSTTVAATGGVGAGASTTAGPTGSPGVGALVAPAALAVTATPTFTG